MVEVGRFNQREGKDMSVKRQQTLAATGVVTMNPSVGVPACIQVTVTGSATYEVKFSCDSVGWMKPEGSTTENATKIFPIFIPLETVEVSATIVTGQVIVTLLET